MQHHNGMTTHSASWRTRVQHVAVVVRPVFAGRVAVALVDSITRNAVKPAPSGQDRGVS